MLCEVCGKVGNGNITEGGVGWKGICPNCSDRVIIKIKAGKEITCVFCGKKIINQELSVKGGLGDLYHAGCYQLAVQEYDGHELT